MSSAENSERRHANEREFLRFVGTQHSAYIKECVSWLKAEYPGSVDACLPDLRKHYTAAIKREQAAAKKFLYGA